MTYDQADAVLESLITRIRDELQREVARVEIEHFFVIQRRSSGRVTVRVSRQMRNG